MNKPLSKEELLNILKGSEENKIEHLFIELINRIIALEKQIEQHDDVISGRESKRWR